MGFPLANMELGRRHPLETQLPDSCDAACSGCLMNVESLAFKSIEFYSVRIHEIMHKFVLGGSIS